MRLPHLLLAIGVLLAISATIWITLTSAQTGRDLPPRAGRDVRDNSRPFDTTGGQEMKPKWND